CHYIFNTC
uniref:Skin secreted peptide 4 n=1 Tax=Ascaphus truei TaxID=8439 RepID=SKSP4_ASCTR|nr:RecName: Full=Skin secreted peptide 4 [Ascaphus truei]